MKWIISFIFLRALTSNQCVSWGKRAGGLIDALSKRTNFQCSLLTTKCRVLKFKAFIRKEYFRLKIQRSEKYFFFLEEMGKSCRRARRITKCSKSYTAILPYCEVKGEVLGLICNILLFNSSNWLFCVSVFVLLCSILVAISLICVIFKPT